MQISKTMCNDRFADHPLADSLSFALQTYACAGKVNWPICRPNGYNE